jgi:hypothetical protein
LGEWEALADYHQDADIPEHPIRELLDGKFGYHMLERSCITMALASVDWANHRIHRRAKLGEPKRIRIAACAMPAFLSALVSGERTPLLLRVPAALYWIIANQTVIPARAHEVLDEAGLLQHRMGRVVRHDFDNRRKSPYGVIADHIIY